MVEIEGDGFPMLNDINNNNLYLREKRD